MKTRFALILAASAAALAPLSCSRDISPVRASQQECSLTVNVGVPSSRAVIPSGNTDDMAVNSVQVFVYDSGGALEKSSGKVVGGSEITLSISPGEKTVWVLVNAPETTGAASLDAFPVMSSALSDNSLTSLVMSGSGTVSVSGNSSITVLVSHIAAKIVLDQVTRHFTNTYYSGIPMTLKGIYMSNVAADYGYTGTGPSEWICKQGVLSDPVDCAALLADMSLDAPLNEGETYSVQHTFYVYPNPVQNDSDATTWCPRKTRLVLKCDYNGRDCYYPVTIPGEAAEGSGTIERNKVYHISGLTLTRPGSTSTDSKDPEVSSDVNCTFSVTVSNWDDDISYTENF